jgi:hypothetical protein
MARVLGIGVTLAAFGAFGSPAALAHDWHPLSCCSAKDCRPSADAMGESVLASLAGWELWDGRVITRNTAKVSPDGKFHLCEIPSRKILCFFSPPGASWARMSLPDQASDHSSSAAVRPERLNRSPQLAL